MKNVLFLLILSVSVNSVAQNRNITTSDIDNFWAAYDQLEKCKTKADSIQLFHIWIRLVKGLLHLQTTVIAQLKATTVW